MKKVFGFTLFICLSAAAQAQSIGIGTTTPHASAALHISSTQKGLLLPVMDSSQKNAIASPAQGLLIYQSRDNAGFYYFAGGKWNKVGGDGDVWTRNTANDIYTNSNVGIGNNSPTEKLDITGNIKTTGEIKPNGTNGQANQVLASTGTGRMVWTDVSSISGGGNGNGGWGDCSIYNIDSYYPVGDTAGESSAYFGRSVAISGDYAIVGAYQDDEGAGLTDNGAAIIYKRNTTTGGWDIMQKLVNPSASSYDHFGYAVAISGDFAIVGAPLDIEGGGSANNGSATIYKRNTATGVWEMVQKLSNPSLFNDYFGYSVAISGDNAAIGAPGDDEGFPDNGSVTMFKRNTATGVWEMVQKLINPAAGFSDEFGWSVSVSGDYLLAGTPGDGFGNTLNAEGSASIFKRNTGTGLWELVQKLTDPQLDINDNFGFSVSISGDYAIIGSPNDDEGLNLTNNGSATIFKRNTATGVWQAVKKLVNAAAASEELFGNSVAISGDYIMVGAPNDDDAVAGLTNNGSASIYKKIGNVWNLSQKFTAPASSNNDFFGTGISIDGATARFITGAPGTFNATGLVFFGKVK